MTRTAHLVVAAAALVCLAGCGDGSLVPVSGEAPRSATSSAPAGATSSVEPTPNTQPVASPVLPPGPSTAAPSSTSSAPTPEPTPEPTTEPATGTPSRALASVRTDVARVAPELERYYQDREYPVDLAQVRSTLAEADVVLAGGNTVAGYDYDGDAVEFELCVEHTSGAFATYDTAPMRMGRSGESGGCPGR